ncbi:MAG: NTP transferase domain-containing protein [Gemmataceae bacterium]|nr:NTP transferase domain-containing protein [Gemmataceae bacterium]
MLHAMIMAGGGGTRFWPRSRQKKPKQFLSLVGESTLLQQTLERIEAMVEPQRTWILTAAVHHEECAKQLPAIPGDNIVGEPMGRDTAGCIALAAALIARSDPDATMAVLPADHVIEPAQLFRRTLQVAVQMAEEHPSSLITLGIPPTFPATGYGYIHRGEELGVRQNTTVFRVKAFREKPNFDTAQQMLAGGEYFWNAGIFVWKVRTILDALRANQPAIRQAAQTIAESWNSPHRLKVLRREYEAMPKISIDYAVMEKAPSVLVVQAPYRWDDVGSWLALERMQAQDADGNTVQALHCGIDTARCVIVGDAGKLIATVGVKDLLIIQDGDAVLVADRSQEGAIKNLVDLLKQRGLEKYR